MSADGIESLSATSLDGFEELDYCLALLAFAGLLLSVSGFSVGGGLHFRVKRKY